MRSSVDPSILMAAAGQAVASEGGRYIVPVDKVGVRPFPFPYRACLAVDNCPSGLEAEQREVLCAFLNTSQTTPLGDGLGLEVSPGLIEPGPSVRDTFRLAEIGRAGWFGTRHLHVTRSPSGGALSALQSFETTAAEHGEPSAVVYCEADGSAGPEEGSISFDAFRRHGVRFLSNNHYLIREKFGDHLSYRATMHLRSAIANYRWEDWQDALAESKLCGVSHVAPSTQLMKQLALEMFNRTLLTIGDASDRMLAFKRFQGRQFPTMPTYAAEVTSARLDALEKLGGAVIVRQHFGLWSRLGGHSRDMSVVRNAGPPLDEHGVICWQDIARRQDSGSLLVATPDRLLRILHLRETIRLEVEQSPDRWLVTLEALECPVNGTHPLTLADLNGLSLLIPADAPQVDVRVAGWSSGVDFARGVDPHWPQQHVLHRKWQRLEWPLPE